MQRLFSLFVALLLLLLPPTALAQQRFSASSVFSYCIPNSSQWNYIAGWGSGVELGWWIEKQWADEELHLIRRPYNAGVRLNFTCFPDGIAGHRIGFVGFIQEPLPFFDHLFLELAFNAALYTSPYKRSHDTLNVFIGSYVNCLIHVGLTYKWQLARQSAITLSAKFAHSSVGYLYKPNKGLNYLQLELGYDFPLKNNNHSPSQQPTASSQQPTSNSLLFSYAPGIVMSRLTPLSDHRYYYAHTTRIGFQHNFNRKRAAGITLDLTNNCSQDSIRRANNDFPLPFNTALTAHYETWFNHLSLHIALGAYLASNSYVFKPYYERVGLYYYFGDDSRRVRHFAGISLKAHATRIDFIEWHYGFKFKLKTDK